MPWDLQDITKNIINGLNQIQSFDSINKYHSPYGKGKASHEIVDILMSLNKVHPRREG